ncbi:MAG: hypothetical protein GY942_20800, partial [Aestuariibacter sp.]|nr:hypothetical protein [Aestuariibacter sp.]
MESLFVYLWAVRGYFSDSLLAGLLVSIGCRSGSSRALPTNDDKENLSSATGSAQPVDKGGIVYASYSKGSYSGELYVINDDGSEQMRLTYNEADDYNPAWSPDGCEIAFSSNRDGLTRVYIMNADGSQVHRLTNLQGISEGNPAWSSDKKRIAFQATTVDGYGKTTLQLVDLASGEIRELVDSEYVPQFPIWSPDSQFVWFASFKDR